MDFTVLGIDAGATLCKIAVARNGEFVTRQFASTDLDLAADYIREQQIDRVVATGGGASHFSEQNTGRPVAAVPEFEAWAAGAPVLAARAGLELPERYLLVSLGTGTSVLLMGGGSVLRVGGSALGGGTLLGLGQLLLGAQSFDEITGLAQKGDRRAVDLLVGDIYTAEETPLPRDLNASSFAKLASREPADLARALVGLIAENIGLICAHIAKLHGATAILFCGSTFVRNPALHAEVDGLTEMMGSRAFFLEEGGFCGAVGASLLGSETRADP